MRSTRLHITRMEKHLSRPPLRQATGKSGSLLSFGLLAAIVCLSPQTSQAQQSATSLSAEMRALLRTEAPVLVVRHVTLFDGTGSAPMHDAAVLVDHGRIRAVGRNASVLTPVGALVVDGTGKTMLPGLVGMHEHLFFPKLGGSLILGAELGQSAPRMYLSAGVTTARTTGSIEPVTDLAIKHLIETGKQAGPDLDLTGPYLDGPDTGFLPNQAIKNPSDVRETVQYWSQRGITSFKAYMFLPPEDLQAAIEAAHAQGMKLTGHLCSVGYKQAIAMGIDNLEHGLIEDSDLNPATPTAGVCPDRGRTEQAVANVDVQGEVVQSLIRELVKHHVAITSTLAVYVDSEPAQPTLESLASSKAAMSPSAWDAYLSVRKHLQDSPDKELQQRMIKKEMAFEREFFQKGGLLMAGADPTGVGNVVAGIADAREMELLIEAGFSPAEAVTIFSRNGARYLNREQEIGTVEVGKRADLVLLNGDFERDASAIERPEIVFKEGLAWDTYKLRISVAGLTGEL